MADFNGKTVLITGGTSGIGKAAASAFLSLGAKVIITGQDKDRLAEAVASFGNRVHGIVADQERLEDLDALGGVLTAHAPLDVLVLNAGVTFPASTAEETPARFDKQMAINLRGPFFTVQKLSPLLRDGGAIVAVTSCLDQLGMPGMAVYSATKAGLRSMVRTWAAEFLGRKIRANAVAPGPINTPIYGKLGLPPEQLQQMAAGIQAQVPMQRFGDSNEIASAIVFLAGAGASFVNGEELTVDGGWAQL